jgi:hypothetical protein
VISGAAFTLSLNQAESRRRKQNITPRPAFCPSYEERAKLLI